MSLLAKQASENANKGAMGYTRLGKSGLKISKVVLGAMSFGTMEDWMLPEDKALPILKHAFDRGINSWDTADVYSYGGSERIVGKALKTYNIPRDRVVILSKCGGGIPDEEEMHGLSTMERLVKLAVNDGPMVNRIGLSRKHIFDAVRASVERLGTHIDVLQIHRLDRDTPREEIMKALNDVIEEGLVRYIGASSMFAWECQTLNNIAEENGWHKFISMQDHYSLLHREEEREMHPYCRDVGIGIIPWSPLARGLLTRPYKKTTPSTPGAESAPGVSMATVRQQTDIFGEMLVGPVTDADAAIIGRVEELAKAKGCTMAQVATTWCLHKGVNPIVGLSSIERVNEAADAVNLHENGLLSDADVAYLEELYVPKAALSSGW